MFVNFWKIVNGRGLNADRRFMDERRAVISSEDDPRLTTLTSLDDTVLKMKGVHGKRKQQLTADTCMSFVHTWDCSINKISVKYNSYICYDW